MRPSPHQRGLIALHPPEGQVNGDGFSAFGDAKKVKKMVEMGRIWADQFGVFFFALLVVFGEVLQFRFLTQFDPL